MLLVSAYTLDHTIVESGCRRANRYYRQAGYQPDHAQTHDIHKFADAAEESVLRIEYLMEQQTSPLFFNYAEPYLRSGFAVSTALIVPYPYKNVNQPL